MFKKSSSCAKIDEEPLRNWKSCLERVETHFVGGFGHVMGRRKVCAAVDVSLRPGNQKKLNYWKTLSSPHIKKAARRVNSNAKATLTCFFDCALGIHSKRPVTVKEVFLRGLLKRLRNSARRKKFTPKFLQHDNAPVHTACPIHPK